MKHGIWMALFSLLSTAAQAADAPAANKAEGGNSPGKASYTTRIQAKENNSVKTPEEHLKRYSVNADGTVKDTVTGLIWMRCSMGQEWDGKTCSGEAGKYRWKDAKAIKHEFAGHSDWRLPNLDELSTLMYCSNGKPEYFNMAKDASEKDWGCAETKEDYAVPTIVQEVFPNTPWLVWSDTPHKSFSTLVWNGHFGHGDVNFINRLNYIHVRLVRKEK